jgi:hypothetical protein
MRNIREAVRSTVVVVVVVVLRNRPAVAGHNKQAEAENSRPAVARIRTRRSVHDGGVT